MEIEENQKFMVMWIPDPAEIARGGSNVAEHADTLLDAEVKRVEMVMRFLPVGLLSKDTKTTTRIIHGALRKPNGVEELKTIFELYGVPRDGWNVQIVPVQ